MKNKYTEFKRRSHVPLTTNTLHIIQNQLLHKQKIHRILKYTHYCTLILEINSHKHIQNKMQTNNTITHSNPSKTNFALIFFFSFFFS